MSFAAAAVLALTLPPGFVLQPQIAKRAALAAGKAVTVSCATNRAAWQSAAVENARGGKDAIAYVDAVGGTAVSLSPLVCRHLVNELAGRKVNWLDFGAAVHVLAHESEHLAGIEDEGVADCRALAAVPKLARAFGVKKAATLKKVLQGARESHAAAVASSDEYRGPCDG